ncbi:hypothetical protein OsI_31244 [Oryza sativa Indica Group]|uniref:Uncharacterized protein n=1 Tax=Oryza sativa subsp. indica TaxID=39946 RepID=B8BF33_ORYSI|nr:hypothetical protein OsI_31244 [Oryza sativa Indica Group]
MLTSAGVRQHGYAAGTCAWQVARQQAAGAMQQAEGKQQQQHGVPEQAEAGPAAVQALLVPVPAAVQALPIPFTCHKEGPSTRAGGEGGWIRYPQTPPTAVDTLSGPGVADPPIPRVAPSDPLSLPNVVVTPFVDEGGGSAPLEDGVARSFAIELVTPARPHSRGHRCRHPIPSPLLPPSSVSNPAAELHILQPRAPPCNPRAPPPLPPSSALNP